jgi:uncharacterized protein
LARENKDTASVLHDPESGRLRPFWKVLAFAGFALVGYVASAMLAFVLAAVTPLPAGVILPLFGAVALIAISWLLARLFEGQSIAAIGIGLDRPWARHVAIGTLVGAGLLGCAWVLFNLCGWATFERFTELAARYPKFILAVLLCLSVAVSEELLFRGYALQVLARWNLPAAVVLTGMLFVAIHLPNAGGTAPIVIANVFLAHLLYTACYLRTRSLWLPIGLHASWNFTGPFVLGMPLSVPEVSILTTDLKPGLWTGNEFGPEGGLIVTLLLAIATAVAWRFVKQRNPRPDLLSAETPVPERGPEPARYPPPTPQSAPSLAPESKRILAIDVLRGIAILGILPMNMQIFAMIDGAFLNPYAGQWTDKLNVAVWAVQHVLIGHKDLTIFCMLFGAGIVMIDARCRAKGQSAIALHYRRMAILLVIGLLHAYLIWHGDILFTFAMCGFVVYLFRDLRPRLLVLLGVLAYAVPMGLLLVGQWALPRLPEDLAADVHTLFRPTADQIAQYNAAYSGSWLKQMPHRAGSALGLQTVLLVVAMGWVALGMMLVGIGLHKLRVFSGELSSRTYLLMLGAGVLIGWPLILFGLYQNFTTGWTPERSFFGGRIYSECAFPIMAVGWIGLVMLVCKYGKLKWLTQPISAVGRMALTNYLMHSVICSLIFYGHGLGMVGRIDRVGQLGIAVAIWIAQLIYSPLWLRRYRFGPVEWLWRTLTYGKPQPMHAKKASL